MAKYLIAIILFITLLGADSLSVKKLYVEQYSKKIVDKINVKSIETSKKMILAEELLDSQIKKQNFKLDSIINKNLIKLKHK